MEPRRPSRRSFLAAVLTRAASLWVAVTGGLSALGAGCDDGPRPAPDEAKKYGAPPPEPPRVDRRQPQRDAPLYGAPPQPPQTLYGAPRPLPDGPPMPRPVPAPLESPPRGADATPPPKYGAPVRTKRQRPKPRPPPEGT